MMTAHTDVVLTPIFRIEGMATDVQCSQYSERNHDGTRLCLGHGYSDSLYPYGTTQGIPPLALIRKRLLEPFLKGLFYKYGRKFYFSASGEIVPRQVLLVPCVSYPVMVLFTGSAAKATGLSTHSFPEQPSWYSDFLCHLQVFNQAEIL